MYEFYSNNVLKIFSFFRIIKELQVTKYGLSPEDHVDIGLLYGYSGKKPVKSLVEELEKIYCGSISYEFKYLEVN